jgi:hypothetical protein
MAKGFSTLCARSASRSPPDCSGPQRVASHRHTSTGRRFQSVWRQKSVGATSASPEIASRHITGPALGCREATQRCLSVGESDQHRAGFLLFGSRLSESKEAAPTSRSVPAPRGVRITGLRAALAHLGGSSSPTQRKPVAWIAPSSISARSSGSRLSWRLYRKRYGRHVKNRSRNGAMSWVRIAA